MSLPCTNKEINFDPEQGTMQRGQASCPFCQVTANSKYLQNEGNARRIGNQLIATVTVTPGHDGKQYHEALAADLEAVGLAEHALESARKEYGDSVLLQEPLIVWSGVFNAPLFGMTTFGDLFTRRQLLSLTVLTKYVKQANELVSRSHDADYGKAVRTILGIAASRFSDFSTTLCTFNYTGGRGVLHTFARQALPMVWDYAETAPLNPQGANWEACIEAACGVIEKIRMRESGTVSRASATSLPYDDSKIETVVTDPPYYDAVPYSDLSDFFFVVQKRSLQTVWPDLFRTPLTPKKQELVSHLGTNYPGERKEAADYEAGMAQAFVEIQRVLAADGICAVMFAHKTTTAWESLISSLLRAGLVVTTSWPFHTERPGRLRAQDSAALASSVTLVCRKRVVAAGGGLWDDVRKELREIAKERLDFFWSQGIRGADFFISAIGPALSVFGKFERVTKLTGDEVTVGQFLDEVRSLVTNYALAKIMKTSQTANIDPESQFYVIWKWSYGETKVPADESFKLAQALGIDTELMWDRTGVLEKAGENVLAVSVAKRMKIKNLGEPDADAAPASLIDVLHRMCVFRDKGDAEGMTEFLARSRQGRNSTLWLVAQAISEILPDGDKEKQLMQGLLNQRDNIEEEARKGKLF